MKCCVSTDVGTWTNWLTFEPDPDRSPDAGTGFLSPIAYALQQWNFITSGKSHARTGIAGKSKQQRVVLRRRNTVVGGKCALVPSALLVITDVILLSLSLFYLYHGCKKNQGFKTRKSKSWNGQGSDSSLASAKLSQIKTQLKRCGTTDNRWRR